MFDNVAKEYWNSVSPKSMALSFELLEYIRINEIEQSKKPLSILDLGSGLSTVYFRLLQKENPEKFSSLFTADDDTFWMGQTVSFLKRHDLPTSKLYPEC